MIATNNNQKLSEQSMLMFYPVNNKNYIEYIKYV